MGFGGEPFRPVPQGDPGDYTSFGARMPHATHSRPASCEEYGCPMMAKGWTTNLNESLPNEAEAARWIRKASGRQFTEVRGEDGITQFAFTPGQPCFADGRHMVRNGRPETLLIARGDWRAYERPAVVGQSEFSGRLGEHMEYLIDARRKG